jgi:hypothetical protein
MIGHEICDIRRRFSPLSVDLPNTNCGWARAPGAYVAFC